MTQQHAADYAVIGTGPGGCAAAVTLSRLGHTVALYGRRAARRTAVESAGGLTLLEGDESHTTSEIRMGEDIAQAVRGVENIIVMVPTSALIDYAVAMAPYVSPSAKILLAPGHTGGVLAFARGLDSVVPGLSASVAIAETFTLPYVARMTGDAEVTVWRRMSHLLIGARPVETLPIFLERFSPVFPGLEAVPSVMESSLSNINAVLHPPGMIGNVGWIESTSGGFRFYSEGVTPGIAAMMTAIDDERRAVATAFGIAVKPFLELFEAAGLVEREVAQTGSVYDAVRLSGPNTLISSPSSLTDRYVVEDVGCGLVAIAALGDTASVATPVIDSFITLAGVINGVDYFESGLNAERLGISGLSVDEVLAHARG